MQETRTHYKWQAKCDWPTPQEAKKRADWEKAERIRLQKKKKLLSQFPTHHYCTGENWDDIGHIGKKRCFHFLKIIHCDFTFGLMTNSRSADRQRLRG